MHKIDFVIPWVDGSDEKWQKDKNSYSNEGTEFINDVAASHRYRDMGCLKYLFRSVEKFTPWVNKVYFITYGHLPIWLNTECPKLVVVNHKDYIPERYLPTFSSNPIELNMHRIKGLSEHFVYFNDDMYFTDFMQPEDFFMNGIPVDSCIESALRGADTDIFPHFLLNDVTFINRHFSKYQVVKQHWKKWFSLQYKKGLLNNIVMLPWNKFSSFQLRHLPQPYLKSTLSEVWDAEPELLDEVSGHKFRNKGDVNQYIFRYWQFCKGKFVPKNINGAFKFIGRDTEQIIDIIEKQSYKMLCINDFMGNYNFEESVMKISDAFEKILPEKSEYEI